MAAGGALCRYSPADSAQENVEVNRGDAGSLHERLVAYVHSLEHGSRRGVWGEHSYARSRLAVAGGGEGARGTRRARALLAPAALAAPAPAADADVDVVGLDSAPPSPPGAAPEPPDQREQREQREQHEDPADAEEWEARVRALAPSAAHARLATGAMRALRRMRLARLVSGGGPHARGEARAAARRLRLALAPAWPLPGAAAWLQAALTASVPRGPRALYEETLAALRRSRPRLAERLTGARSRGAEADAAPPRPVPACSEPWLVWVSSGCAALDARWERRLAGLVHTRVLRAGAGAGAGEAGAAPPEAWCAGVAGAMRSQLTDALAEAGDRSVILGGVGAGAALCLLLARGAGGAERAAGGVRGAVLAAPPLRTAEGPRAAADDALPAVRLPLLLLVGTRAPDAPRAIAHDVCERSGAGGAGARRVVEVHGADAALRLPPRLRRRLRLPQRALDAALAEECVRWAIETAEGEEPPASPPRRARSPAPAPRRHPLPTIVHRIDLDGPSEDLEHQTAPPAPAPAPPLAASSAGPPVPPLAAITAQSGRSIEIVEGRVVSRAAGGTPLPLLPPPRRAAPPAPPAPAAAPPAPPPPAHSPADIMQMPIVFADDNATDSSSTGSPVTVTSGKARGSSSTPPVKMTRVILAKRGGRAGGGVLTIRPGGAAGAGAPAGGSRGGPAPPRRLLVRRGMRLISRQDKA